MQREVRLRSSAFRHEREGQWHKLKALIDRVERKGYRSLAGRELSELPALYRAAVSSLSVARSISLDRNLVEYLESLVARAYFCIYGVKPRPKAVVSTYFLNTFPRLARRAAPGIFLALAILLAGTAVGWVSQDPEAYAAILPHEQDGGRSPASSTEELRAVLYDDDHTTTRLGEFSTMLLTHNAGIGFLAFALGFALGIPTVLLIFANGLMLGALAGLYASRGLSLEFWAWVLPHGVTELLAICLCGGAGLQIALALARPGRHGRLHALKQTGREAALLVLGALLMFILAGLIEGFFRQLVHNVPVRLLVTGVTFCFWMIYLSRCGRSGLPAAEEGL